MSIRFMSDPPERKGISRHGRAVAAAPWRRLIEQRDRAGPAGRRAIGLVSKARDRQIFRLELVEIAQLLPVAVGNLAARLVSLPYDRGFARLEPALTGVHEGGIPAPRVDAGDPDPTRGQVERRLPPHAASGREVFVRADAAPR